MIKKLLILLITLSLPVALLGQRGACGAGVSWSIDKDSLIITGNGEMSDFDRSADVPSWELYQSKIKHVVVRGNVSKIGDNAFSNYEEIVSVKLGEGVKKVGNSSFFGCLSLTSLSLPTSLEEIGDSWTPGNAAGHSFQKCVNLEEVTLPEHLKFMSVCSFSESGIKRVFWNAEHCEYNDYISDSFYDVFASCPVEEVHFGTLVKYLPHRAFYQRGRLSKVTTMGSIEYVDEAAFQETAWLNDKPRGEMVYLDNAAYLYKDIQENLEPLTVVLPEGTTGISPNALKNNKKLVKVVLPSTLKRIGLFAFDGCSSLGEVEYNAIELSDYESSYTGIFPKSLWSITFGEKVKRLPAYCLYHVDGLSELHLPLSLESIGEHALDGCNGLTELVIPDNVKSIELHALYELKHLQKLTMGEGLEHLTLDYVFGQCSELKTIYWNAIHYKGQYDMYHGYMHCMAPLETLVFGDKVEYVPAGLFSYCKELKKLVLGKSVKVIGEHAFGYCEQLQEVDLPESLDSIGDYAFRNTALKHVFLPKSVKSLGTWGFAIRSLKSVISTPEEAPQNGSSFIDVEKDAVLYVPDTWRYDNGWEQYSPMFQPMVKADANEFYYDGTTPEVKFTCNIPNYELASLTEVEMDGATGQHSLPMTAVFKGPRDFTVNVMFNYVVHKGVQEIKWEQDLTDLHVGDTVVLSATTNSDLDITFLEYNNNVMFSKKDGKSVMICLQEAECEVMAYQYGDDNWEPSNTVTKKVVIKARPLGIEGVEEDASKVLGTYDLSGRKSTSSRMGILLIRYDNGKVKKVLKK